MKSMMIFASEVPVIVGLNPFRKIEDVFFNVWKRTCPDQVDKYAGDTPMTKEDSMNRTLQTTGLSSIQNKAVVESSKAFVNAQVQKTIQDTKSIVNALVDIQDKQKLRGVLEEARDIEREESMEEVVKSLEKVQIEMDKVLPVQVAQELKTNVEEVISAKPGEDRKGKLNKVQDKVNRLFSLEKHMKEDIDKHVTSKLQQTYGKVHEKSATNMYEKTSLDKVTDTNLKFYHRYVGDAKEYKVSVGGRIDGLVNGQVVEVKNRIKAFKSPLPKYDIAQLQTYLYILDGREGKLIEHLRTSKDLEMNTTIVPRDDQMWNTTMVPFLASFSNAMATYTNDTDMQKAFVAATPLDRRDMIRTLWINSPNRF